MGVRGFAGDERGIALLDMLVVCALIATFTIASATVFGMRPRRVHTAALALESAMAEARGLASANADATDVAYPSGATVVLEPIPALPGYSQIAVYRSRPVAIGGKQPFAPPADLGFPPQRVFATFSFQSNAGRTIAEPFAIMLSGAGYASIVPLNGAYDASNPPIFTRDPGCAQAGARIAVDDGSQTESHAFACSGGTYAAT